MAKKPRAQLTRRALLIGGGSAVALASAAFAVDENILPGRSTMFKMLGLDASAGVIALHGFGGSHRGGFTKNFTLQPFQAQAVARGSHPFATPAIGAAGRPSNSSSLPKA
ncbi:MAG: hypothetical protein JWQ39_2340 [Glaciihabitans sp.]|jgi:hypothetical protein|nr:hypothetical protein [Glaciihabitans sp.]